MKEENTSKYGPDEIRAEYSAVVGYHTAIVNSRFTVAGLYVAAVGFLAAAVLGKETSAVVRIAASGLACWLTLCLWILELRSRALFTNLAHRGIDIEHRYWGLTKDEDWYRGFFSRMYKEPPPGESIEEGLPRRKYPDRPTIFWFKNPMNMRLSRFISHGIGLDLLYAGCGIFWLVAFAWSVMTIIFGCCIFSLIKHALSVLKAIL